ncbi:hypothetical protein RHMOL_Rhmol05G0021900 [Rhododendron molle]|uniref:Uncharacterized protein n=1 Tax=Rhododendron molle TaxID=49168 RepID=A0ACC0NLN4_RHOML|nr:hypothetical protein RHMOL_Rhmol05G0021900 [Rhododendron molle]
MRQIIFLLVLIFPILKPTLHAKDKKILAVGVTIQVSASIAHVYTNESSPSNSNLYLTLALLLVDFMSFMMVFVPIFSSIKTIKEAAKRNGTAARDLEKMRLLAYFNGCVAVFWRMKWLVWLSVDSGFSSVFSEDCGLECLIVRIEQTVALGFYIAMFFLFWPRKQNECFVVQDEEMALSTVRGDYGSIFTSSKGKGSAVSCLTTDVGSVGLCGGSSDSNGSIFTSSKGKGCLGDVLASGVSGSSGNSDGLCSDVGSCSSSKGKGLGVIRSEWRLEVEKERDLLPTFCQHRDRALLSDGWRHYIKEVNQRFEGGAVEFRDKLAKFAIFYGFDYSFAKNERDRVTPFCKDADCKWRVHARTTPQKRSIDVVSSLKGLYGVDVPYKRAWKGVEKGRSEAFGDYDASFDELRWYREAVKNSDPESVFEIEVDTETNRFKRLFVAFSACIYGFKHLRPLLFVDGTFLKGNFKGSLLSVSAKDGDKGLFPLCIGVADFESNENWLWFMEKLRGILDGDTRSIVFVSDRNAGIKAAVPKVFPSGFHGYFLYHLKNNLRGRLTGGRNKYKERVVGLFSLCAYAPNEMKFNEEMARLKKAGGESRITNFLADLPYEHWANAFFPGQRYGEMWSNLAECFNSWIEKERHLSITQLVDRVRIKLMELL